MDFFDLVDSNQDGTISVKEYEFMYSLIDVDQNVALSHLEIKNYVSKNLDSICAPYRATIIFESKGAVETTSLNMIHGLLDSDGDGQISEKEFFLKLDLNGDGLVDEFELKTYFEKPIYNMVYEEALADPIKWMK